MMSGYCKCGFPAMHVCPSCGAKYCNNCKPAHACKPEAVDKPEVKDAPAPVLDYKRKPGRPYTKK
jgi:hypothetical protein